MKETIYVILVNYNGKAYNQKCLKSILGSRVEEDLHVIVVDNASTDGSVEELREQWSGRAEVQILALDDNYGFAGGNNEGIKLALTQGAEYILLLNNDTEIKADAIERMIELQKSKGSIVVPKILYADQPDTIWCAGGELSRFIRKSSHTGMDCRDRGQFDDNRRCTFANGCCMLLDRELIQKLGPMDESFFLYYEDNEYSLRAGQENVPIWYCGDAVVYHKVNGATKGNERPDNAYYITRNWLICNRRYLKKKLLLFYVYFFFNRLAWAVIWSAQGKWGMVRAMWKGIKDFRAGKAGKKND